MTRLGVCIVGSSGAVATTVMAGVALMRRGLAPRHGMVTEAALAEQLGLVEVDELVFGGWDLRDDDAYTAAQSHQVVPPQLLDQVKDELRAIKPWPAVVSSRFLAHMDGKHVVEAANWRDELAILEAHVAAFRREYKLDRIVIVNLTSTEKYCEVEDVHQTIDAFEAGLEAGDPRISPAMKFLYLACKLGAPHCNFTPSLSKIPALAMLAEKCGVPIAGEDGKTGQTMIKTALAPAFAVRALEVEGWFSTNILGNNDGRVLDDPESCKTKIASKQQALDHILGYTVENHTVRIDYYPPRGDAKESWDSIDLIGFLGERMQMKVDFLCKDSILAAPLVIDLVRLLDVAHRHGERGIQRQLSLFFKAPYSEGGERPEHDLFKQQALLETWIKKIAARPANGTHPRARHAVVSSV